MPTLWGVVFKDGDAGAFISMKSGVVHGELECLVGNVCQARERQTRKIGGHLKSTLIRVVCKLVQMLIGPTNTKIQSMSNQHLHLELCGTIFNKNREIDILRRLNSSNDLSI